MKQIGKLKRLKWDCELNKDYQYLKLIRNS